MPQIPTLPSFTLSIVLPFILEKDALEIARKKCSRTIDKICEIRNKIFIKNLKTFYKRVFRNSGNSSNFPENNYKAFIIVCIKLNW